MTSGRKNTFLGRYSGNSGGLDIRTSSNNVVLSDGDGNIRLYANSSGNVGIGTVSPGADGNDTPILDIKQTTSGQKAAAYMRVTAETNAAYKSESFYTGHYRDTGNGEYATVAMIGMESVRTTANNIGGDLNFYTKVHDGANSAAPTQKMVIKHDGKVGIGTDNPLFTLHVDSGTTDTVAYFKSSDNKAAILITDDDTNTCLLYTSPSPRD